MREREDEGEERGERGEEVRKSTVQCPKGALRREEKEGRRASVECPKGPPTREEGRVAVGSIGDRGRDHNSCDNFPWARHFSCSLQNDRKMPSWRLRWPSGPSANKTRPHLGLFLHIRS